MFLSRWSCDDGVGATERCIGQTTLQWLCCVCTDLSRRARSENKTTREHQGALERAVKRIEQQTVTCSVNSGSCAAGCTQLRRWRPERSDWSVRRPIVRDEMAGAVPRTARLMAQRPNRYEIRWLKTAKVSNLLLLWYEVLVVGQGRRNGHVLGKLQTRHVLAMQLPQARSTSLPRRAAPLLELLFLSCCCCFSSCLSLPRALCLSCCGLCCWTPGKLVRNS